MQVVSYLDSDLWSYAQDHNMNGKYRRFLFSFLLVMSVLFLIQLRYQYIILNNQMISDDFIIDSNFHFPLLCLTTSPTLLQTLIPSVSRINFVKEIRPGAYHDLLRHGVMSSDEVEFRFTQSRKTRNAIDQKFRLLQTVLFAKNPIRESM